MPFTNRELAIGIWIVIIFCYCLFNKQSRMAMKSILKTLFSRQIISILIVVYGLLFLLINFLYKLNIWNIFLLKDTIIWGITVPLFSLMKAVSSKKDNYFKDAIKECFELVIIVEFLGLNYPFSLPIELILIPLVLLFTLAGELSEKQYNSEVLANFFNILVALIGIIAFYHSFKLAIADINNILTIQTIKEITFVPILTLLYIPLTYLFTIYSKYEVIFIRLGFKEYLSKKEKTKTKFNIFRSCKFNLKKIANFSLDSYLSTKK